MKEELIEPYSILIDGHPALKEKCDKVHCNSPDLQTIIKRMFATLDTTTLGVGLAAPQLGLPVNLFVLGNQVKNKVFINAKIIKSKGAKRMEVEGCLSVPHVYARVERYQKIVVEYVDENWQTHTKMFTGFIARVIQHELDHMEGIEFYDKISDQEFKKLLPSIEKVRKGEFYKPVEYLVKFKEDDEEEKKPEPSMKVVKSGKK